MSDQNEDVTPRERLHEWARGRFDRLPTPLRRTLFYMWLPLRHLVKAAWPTTRLLNRPKDDEDLLLRSQKILRDGKDALKSLNEAKRNKDAEPPETTMSGQQVASFIGAAVAYLGIATYVCGYWYHSTLYNRLLPGMDIEYSYLPVLEATYRQAGLLIIAAVPAVTIASRYFSSDFRRHKSVLREASRYAFLAAAAGHEIRRRQRSRHDMRLDPLREQLRNLTNDVLKDMPDGWWTIATLLQVFRFRLIWVTFGAIVVLGLLVYWSICVVYDLQVWAYSYYVAVQGKLYLAGQFFLLFLLAALAGVIAAFFFTVLLAIEAHYHGHPGKLFRRRLVVGLLCVAVVFLAVHELARRQGAIQVLTYKYRFPQVAVTLVDPLLSPSGDRLLAAPTEPSQIAEDVVVGYQVPVPLSQDCFLLIPRESELPDGEATISRVRIPFVSVRAITRNTGPYDQQHPEAAPDIDRVP